LLKYGQSKKKNTWKNVTLNVPNKFKYVFKIPQSKDMLKYEVNESSWLYDSF
jgi:hypothetical protein